MYVLVLSQTAWSDTKYCCTALGGRHCPSRYDACMGFLAVPRAGLAWPPLQKFNGLYSRYPCWEGETHHCAQLVGVQRKNSTVSQPATRYRPRPRPASECNFSLSALRGRGGYSIFSNTLLLASWMHAEVIQEESSFRVFVQYIG